MKKTLSFVAGAMLLCAAVSALFFANKESKEDIFNANVEALAGEEHTTGYCGEITGLCMDCCPGCNQLVEATGHAGPALKINHCQGN